MTYEFNHVHLKAEDPKAAADWYVKAFGFTIVSDATRNFGDRFIALTIACSRAPDPITKIFNMT